MPYFEFPIAFPTSPLITDLLTPTFKISENGSIEVPDRPGLGFELNECYLPLQEEILSQV